MPNLRLQSPEAQSGKLCSSSVAVHSCKWRKRLLAIHPHVSRRTRFPPLLANPPKPPRLIRRRSRRFISKRLLSTSETLKTDTWQSRFKSRIITWSSAAISLGGIGDAKLLAHFQRYARRKVFSTELSRKDPLLHFMIFCNFSRSVLARVS